MQYSQRQADHLHVLAPRCRGDVSRLRPHVEDDGSLQPWHQEVRALVGHCILDSSQSVEDDSPRAALYIVQRGLEETEANGSRDGRPVNEAESTCRHIERFFLGKSSRVVIDFEPSVVGWMSSSLQMV